MQLHKTRILVADKGIASEAYRIKGRQYDFISCAVTSSEFAALDLIQTIKSPEKLKGIPGNSYVLNLRREFPGIPEIPPGISGNLYKYFFKFLSLIMTVLVSNLTQYVHVCTT